MMNYLWAGLILLSLIFGAASGDISSVVDALTEGACGAVTLAVGLMGAYMFYMGLMNIASEAGLVEKFARSVRKPLRALFPSSERAMGAITMNLAANFIGAGSAATPFGLEAMRIMSEDAGKPSRATDDMCMFLSINSASIEILPAGVLALRASSGSLDVYSVILPTFICSVISFLTAAFCCRLLCRLFPERPL